MAVDADRISVSREALRAELGALELRLVDRLTTALEHKADSAHVSGLESRVASLELSRAARDHLASDLIQAMQRVAKLERFRYAVPGAAAVSAASAISVLLIHYLP
jgi:hypothetical protein